MQERNYAILPLRGVLVFPFMVTHLDVGREKSIAAIEAAMLEGRNILLLSQKNIEIENPQENDLFTVGTIVEIKQLLRLPGGTMRILVEGLYRAKALRFFEDDPFFRAEVMILAEETMILPEVESLVYSVRNKFEELARLSKKISPEAIGNIVGSKEPGRMADLIASHLNLKIEDKQGVLSAVDITARLEKVAELIIREIEILEVERRIGLRVRKQMEKAQKEYYLREQIKAIQKELGDKDEKMAEVEEYREKIAAADLPFEAEEKALKELERLEKMPPASAEGTVVRTYIDWILALPWVKYSRDKTDLKRSGKILEEDHYGLEKVKERILEYLAIRKLTDHTRSPILCLVGPPGVGKTSLAKSIARSLNRNFVRMSLGGMRDEAEIRGHRRTYIGALPGRIIQGIRKAGTGNPVFLLDEIDKLTSDFRGDPASALLEVLDPEQNGAYADHYLEIPFDLSRVLFITTANTADTIPRPLLDRMELIQISGYTEEEKTNIALQHLIPKQMKTHGLRPGKAALSKETVTALIQSYTRESGVRNLEREIANVLRKVAVKVVNKEWREKEVTPAIMEELLGVPRYKHNKAADKPEIGIAAGLAYTPVGGDILFIEVTTLHGKGDLVLTGKLGEVMKESAQAGWTFVRAHAQELGVQPEFYEYTDLHIHVPEGAVPKDGPSAGITMVTAMASALAKRAVRQDVAMTGEITLRGNVLPIGGVKEKVLAAHRAGMKMVILPLENKKDMEEIPKEVRDQLEFRLVDRIERVLEIALLPVMHSERNAGLNDFPAFPTESVTEAEIGRAGLTVSGMMDR